MRNKTVAESATTLSEVMMPMYANHYGSVHGGTILKLADEAAFVALDAGKVRAVKESDL